MFCPLRASQEQLTLEQGQQLVVGTTLFVAYSHVVSDPGYNAIKGGDRIMRIDLGTAPTSTASSNFWPRQRGEGISRSSPALTEAAVLLTEKNQSETTTPSKPHSWRKIS